MVYTSPMKVAHIVTWDKQGIPCQDIANNIGIHCTTVTRILTHFEKSANFYHINLKTGWPHKFEEREAHVAACMLACGEAESVTEAQKEMFPNVSAQVICRRLATSRSLGWCVVFVRRSPSSLWLTKRRGGSGHLPMQAGQWRIGRM